MNKEHSRARAWRLNLRKPHLYWSRPMKEWLVVGCTIPFDEGEHARDWCIEQDERWTPVKLRGNIR